MERISKREVKFEYLRIFSMILIIMAHYAGHGGLAEINSININRFIGSFLLIGGKLGSNLFILISGYFLVDSKFKIKNILKLDLQVLFYSILGLSLSIFIFGKEVYIKDIIKVIIPITYALYWFPTAYIEMYLLSPFINKLIISINKENYKNLLILLSITVSIIPTIIPGAKLFQSNIVLFSYLYLLAGYVKKYDITILENKKI